MTAFDLKAQVRRWRQNLKRRGSFDATTLDELESHLWDTIDGLIENGASEREAFVQAYFRLGHEDALAEEYHKVLYWSAPERSWKDHLTWPVVMLKNYLKVATRNLLKYKMYSGINIGGLAIGLACALLMLLWVRDEISYDRFYEEADTIYRLNWDFKWNNNEGVGSGTPPPLAAALVRDLPEVEETIRLYPVPKMVVRNGDAFFNEGRIISADSNFFDFFDLELLAGNTSTALANPNSVILTEEAAQKYFGDEPPLGKMLTIGDEKPSFRATYYDAFTVTGVVQTPPHNSHLQFDMITSMASHPEVAFFDWSWIWMQVVTYAKVETETAVYAAETKIPELVEKYAPDAFRRVGFSYDELMSSGGRWNFVFQPLTDIYLGSATIGNRVGPLGNRLYVYVFSVIAGFILLIACINFMNLATARSATRAKEVGVRKALGSQKGSLVHQFLMESMLFSVLAMVLAVLLVYGALGPFNQLSGKTLSLSLLDPPWLLGALLLLIVLAGVVAGSYPSFYLSSFHPIHVLKGTFRSSGKQHWLRNGLVTFQFAMTIGLIACTTLVQQQISFVRQADLGFEKEGIVVISNENNRLGDQAESFKERLQSHAGIINASISTNIPPDGGFEDYYKIEGQGDEQVNLLSYMTDEDLLTTLGIEIVQGRSFSENFPADAESILLNEAAVKQFGWDDPIGKIVNYPSRGDYKVIGVMKDFNFLTLRSPITPFALFHHSSQSYQIPDSYVVVRVSATDLAASIALLEEEWKAFVPNMPFEYSFLEQRFDEQYLTDQRLARIFLTFSCLSIFIACIGLLGLAAFAAAQRTKEIGVRKVLGASVGSIILLLSKEFARLVAIAFVVAAPVAYLVMDRWLQDFAYRVGVSWWTFLLAGLSALTVALITVSYQSLKAARSNPINALRYE